MTSRSAIGLLLPAMVPLLHAVNATGAAAQPPRVRDSAGVRIVENGARLKAPVIFRLGTTPLLEVGGLEEKPDVEFNHNHGFLTGARLSGGGLVVIDTDRLHYFDAKSRRVRIVGRRGQGPTEFLYLTSICRTRGDTVVVSDSHNHRLAVVDGAGRIVRTFPQDGLRIPPYSFCFNDGALVLFRNETAFGTTRVQLQRVRLDGSVMNQIGDFSTRRFDFWTQSVPGVPGPTNGDIALEVMGFGTNEILLRRRDSMFAVHLVVYPILMLKQS